MHLHSRCGDGFIDRGGARYSLAGIDPWAFVSAEFGGRATGSDEEAGRARFEPCAYERAGGTFVTTLGDAWSRPTLGIAGVGAGVGTGVGAGIGAGATTAGGNRSSVALDTSETRVADAMFVVRKRIAMVAPTNADEIDRITTNAIHPGRTNVRVRDPGHDEKGPDLAILLFRAKPAMGSLVSTQGTMGLAGGRIVWRSGNSVVKFNGAGSVGILVRRGTGRNERFADSAA